MSKIIGFMLCLNNKVVVLYGYAKLAIRKGFVSLPTR